MMWNLQHWEYREQDVHLPAKRRLSAPFKIKVNLLGTSTTMKQLVLSVFIATMLGGCVVMVPGHLYPVQGSLAAQSPVPIYKVTLSGILESGTMAATLNDGEVCKGSWAAVRQDDPSASSMAVEWDSVYGGGFFVANVLGNRVFARAVLTGTKGTTLNVEFYDPTPGQVTDVKGIAKDNAGNIFKLTF
jgi:hypothetical protein